MPSTLFVRRMRFIVPLLSMSMVLSFGLIGYTFVSSHRQNCVSRGKTLDAVRDIVVLATTPDPARPVTAEELRRMEAFRAAVIARVNSARC